MKARIIFVCIAIMAIIGHTTTLESLVEGKVVEYRGYCPVDAMGDIALKEETVKKIELCVVGFDPKKPHLKYVLLFDQNKPSRLIEFDIREQKQKTIWTRNLI